MGKMCQRCKSDRIIYVSGKCSDLCSVDYKDRHGDGYVPAGIGLHDEGAYGDYVIVEYCLDCGQLQGKFPIPESQVVKAMEEL